MRHHYPYDFIHGDALATLQGLIDTNPLDLPLSRLVIHASFPCQKFSPGGQLATNRLGYDPRETHEDLVTPGRVLLDTLFLTEHVPYVMENVPQAPLGPPHSAPGSSLTLLCGAMFDLPIRRHRAFESTFTIPEPDHPIHSHRHPRTYGLYGSMNDEIPGGGRTAEDLWHAHELLGLDPDTRDWPWYCLREAIPPAYTEYVASFVP
jgi:DNA (cytosine-5)-methyltransferase 1